MGTRREFLGRLAWGAAAGALGVAGVRGSVAAGSAGRPPNVLLVFCDDLGYGDLGVYGAGARGIATPHLDRLAAEGVRFTSFYVAQAVCSASRAGLLTGCFPNRIGILGALSPAVSHGLSADETTLADLLRSRGYATGMVGKWHLGHHRPFLPLQHGFDEYLGLPYSNDMWPVGYDGRPAVPGSKGKGQTPPLPLIDGNEHVATIGTLADQDTLTTRYTERALSFLERHRDRPFLLYVAHSMPHVPLGVSARFRGSSRQGLYGDVIQELDDSVSQLLAALDRLGLRENTLVVFTSDNGPWLNFGNHAGTTGPLREGKGTMFEGGCRVPCIVRWPGVVGPGSVCERMAATVDILPTLAEIAGAALPPRRLDGVSILPLLRGTPGAGPRTEYAFYYGAELQAYRRGPWKLFFPHQYRSYRGVTPGQDGAPGPYATGKTSWELYNLETDLGETTDVAAAHPDLVADLRALGEAHRAELQANARPPGRLPPVAGAPPAPAP